MRRRTFLGLLGSAAFAPSVLGQEAGRTYRVGALSQTAQAFDVFRSVVLPEMATYGFVEGMNLSVLYRSGPDTDLPRLAQELLDHTPNALFGIGTLAARALRQSTSAIPIVLFGGEDAVSEGLAGTLSRPDGNVTGVVILGTTLHGKRIELLHEIIPNMRRVAVLLFSRATVLPDLEREVQGAAAKAGLEPIIVLAVGQEDYPAAFQMMKARGAQALVIGANPRFAADAELLITRAREAGLPTACEWASMVRQGCLVGYGPGREKLYRTAAGKLVQVLQGVLPSSIPIERPPFLELAINLQVARSLSIEIPVSTLAQADDVIE